MRAGIETRPYLLPHLQNGGRFSVIPEGSSFYLARDIKKIGQAEMNKTSMKSNGLGFMYDYSSLSNELTALSNVQEEYLNSIVCGVTDPDEIIPELNEKLYKAGLQKVIDEKQRQFDEWLAAQE